MAEKNIPYEEAAKSFPASYKLYADISKSSPSPSYPYLNPSKSVTHPTTSYKKTVYSKPKSRPILTPGYDKQAHQSILKEFSIPQSENGYVLQTDSTSSYDNTATITELWNARSIHSKKHELMYLSNKLLPSLISIAETWLKPQQHFNLQGFSSFRDDRLDGHGGAMILVNNKLSCSALSIPSHNCNDINVVGVKVKNINVLSIYVPHPNSSLLAYIRNLFLLFPPPLLILGDFNSHNTMWGSDTNDSFGNRLGELLDDLCICVLNNGSSTRITPPEESAKSLPEINMANLDTCYKQLTKSICDAADHSIPLKNSAKHKLSSPPWWDNECTSMIKYRKVAERAFIASMTLENLVEYRKAVAKSKRLFRQKKFHSWRQFCSSLSPNTNASVVWRQINRFRCGTNPSHIFPSIPPHCGFGLL
ncbi:unnamed protein product [Euphydryas editha]|uniref:Endonuclease/exonuclease/phosphatase domain-containing protein n=1 Tax=Euphydryas editha TaxID=104508 RepID=A0AAU9VEZ4_EUPED|nr:unnamed protein product [Euphydryas editha]